METTQTILNYLAPMAQRPRYYLHPPPPGESWRNTRGDRRTVQVYNARDCEEPPTLDREGFALARLETTVADLYDADAVRSRFYPEVEHLVADVAVALRVVAFDHNVRSAPLAERGERGAQGPVRYAHNDYTERSAPQRVRDLLPQEADRLLAGRFAIINFWKPIRGPVEEVPLAFCDAQTLAPEDFVPTDLLYEDRAGEVYSLSYRPEHRWFYYPAMEAQEVLLLKCYDSQSDVARYTAHTAFDDPHSPAGAAARESIEVRTLVFWA